jgi:Flp pilus assembly protein TadG
MAEVRFWSPITQVRIATVRTYAASSSGLMVLKYNCDGAIAVQFAILLLPMLLLILGTFDTGFALLTETRITFAVEAAAKCGAVNTTLCGSPTETATYGASIAAVSGLHASGFVVTTAACGISVTASYPYAGIVLSAVTLRAGACYPTETTSVTSAAAPTSTTAQ